MGVDADRIVVQHNGVEGDRFIPRDKAALRRSLGLPLDRKIICYVGNYKPEKGVDVLVKAMDHLRRQRQAAGVNHGEHGGHGRASGDGDTDGVTVGAVTTAPVMDGLLDW